MNIGVADEMEGVAVVAFHDPVPVCEFFPVPLLFIVEDARSPTERTAALESREYGIPDERGTVRDAVERGQQLLVGLECDDLLFSGHILFVLLLYVPVKRADSTDRRPETVDLCTYTQYTLDKYAGSC